MITQTVKDYMAKNRLCPENIFTEWESFLNLLYAQGGRVNGILWFEHVAIARQAESLGGGGYRDPQNPDYMYAETMIGQKNMESMTLSQVKEYILETIAAHPDHKLMPAFFHVV